MSNYTIQDPPMKWHKFLIYFSLWASAVILVINGAQFLTGSLYGTSQDAERVYQYYNGMKSADTIFGVLCLAVAAYIIYTRFQLAGFKEGAPNKLTVVYILNLVINVGYLFVVSNITKLPVQELTNSTLTSSIISSVVMIIANRVYYNKRMHLFGSGSAGSVISGSSYTSSTGSGYSGDSTVSSRLQTRFCPKCGAKVDPDDNWCTKCGTKLN